MMSYEIRWNSACATMLSESGMDMKELLQQKYLKEYFLNAVKMEKLSQAAANSLLYRLYYLGLLLDIDLLVGEGSVRTVPDLSDDHPAIHAAVRWEAIAPDKEKLTLIVEPYINAARSTVKRIFQVLAYERTTQQ
jgi:hypothetical protein